jgi:hypothetical protein
MGSCNYECVKSTKQHANLPIGRVARIAFEIDVIRATCSKAASVVISQTPLNEQELEDCARLDDTLAHAQRILKAGVREIMLSRIRRGSRKTRAQ